MPISPTLVFAPRTVLRRAEELIPGRVLENEITRAICAGRKTRRLEGMRALPTGWRYVVLDGGEVAAVVAKGEAMLTDRKAWRVVRLVRLTQDVDDLERYLRECNTPRPRRRPSKRATASAGDYLSPSETLAELEARIAELLAQTP